MFVQLCQPRLPNLVQENIRAQHYHTVREVEICTFDPDKITFPCPPKYLDANATLVGIEQGSNIRYNLDGTLEEPHEAHI